MVGGGEPDGFHDMHDATQGHSATPTSDDPSREIAVDVECSSLLLALAAFLLSGSHEQRVLGAW